MKRSRKSFDLQGLSSCSDNDDKKRNFSFNSLEMHRLQEDDRDSCSCEDRDSEQELYSPIFIESFQSSIEKEAEEISFEDISIQWKKLKVDDRSSLSSNSSLSMHRVEKSVGSPMIGMGRNRN